MPYRVEKTTNEIRIYSGTHHFLSIIHDGGIFDLRAHPGQDPNGWGTSLYLQPFFPGAVLTGSVIDTCLATEDGLVLVAHGTVSLAENEIGGTWSTRLLVNERASDQRVYASGTYQIHLLQPLTEAQKGDLNILKIASNYLRAVPQQTGTCGDTGDVGTVAFTFDDQKSAWDIADPTASTFFQPALRGADYLRMELSGNYYDVDSRAQGFDPSSIVCAYKPSLTLTLLPKASYPLTIFAHCEDGIDARESDKLGRDVRFSEGYWYDNVGITPLILCTECSEQTFLFEIEWSATSIEPLTNK